MCRSTGLSEHVCVIAGTSIEPRDDNEIGLAHDAALNAWMAAKWKEASDD